mmetsp:Transcript_67168/g.98279  ORF Transcript_67168/g.98279 Transcript_67168/m.98279 type:complete len:1088 (+) Transcript_67168:74-3337(+)
MTKVDRLGAFVPVIPFGGNLANCAKDPFTSFSGRQTALQIKFHQTCYRFNSDIFNKGLNSKSDQQIAEELLNDLNFEKKESKTYIDDLSSTSKKSLVAFATITSAIFSWIITPTKGKLLSFIFSFIAGSVVYLLLKKFNSKNINGVQKEVLEKISEQNIKPDLTEFICSLEKEYSLTSDEMRKELLTVYKRYLMFFLKNTLIDLDEVNKLITLKKLFGLSSLEIGECHYRCSQEIFNTNLLFLERQTSDETSNIVDKFLFLSDRLFSLDSKKGYQYETSRIKRVLNFSTIDFEETKNKLSEELYIRLIKPIQNGQLVSPKILEEAKQVLGIDTERSEIINETIFKDQIKSKISREEGFNSTSVRNLKNLQAVLSIKEKDFILFITQESSLIIQDRIDENIKQLLRPIKSEEIKNVSICILENKEKFLVSQATILSIYYDSSRSLFIKSMKSTLSSIRSKTISLITEKIETLLVLNKNLNELFLFLNDSDNNSSQNEINKTIMEAVQTFSSIEVHTIYRLFIENLMKEAFLTEEKEKNMKNLQKLLNISETDSIGMYKNVIGPIFQKTVRSAIEDNKFSNDKKILIENLIISLKIDKSLALILKTSMYRQTLQELVSNKSVFSTQDLKKLDQIRIFLDLSFINVQTIHDTLCEPIFKKSIQEAMGASGIVPSNYWDGLEKLRKRLRLTEFRSKDIFYNVMKDRLKNLFEKAIADDKKKNQPKNEDNKDSGEDPTVAKGSGTALGIEASNPEGNELLNLVEIYFRNRVFSDSEFPSVEQKKEMLPGLSGRMETLIQSKAEINFSYPVTLKGLFEKKILSDLYKQYLIECFSSKLQSEKRRLFSNLSKLGPILGLENDEIKSIHSNVGISIYQRFLSQSLSKGFLDTSDTTFLTTIQNTLAMENSVCNQLIKDSKKGVISLAIEKVFASPRINPENVIKIRKMADQFNINFDKDLNISDDQRSKLFRIEIDSGIEKGEIDNKSLDSILKIQNSYVLENIVAKKILFDCVNTKCEGSLLNAIASLRRNDEAAVVKELEKMLNFGDLLPINFKNNLVSANEKSQLFFILQSIGGESEAQKSKLDLFKTMINL